LLHSYIVNTPLAQILPALKDFTDVMAPKKARLSYAPPQIGELNYVRNKSKFEVYGEEMIEKVVKQSGNSGRVYLPPEWVGKYVKIIRID
jgi:putative transposon-encoded protein